MSETNSEMISKNNKNILMHAWKLFATYDKNATIQQSLYKKFQMAILLLGIIVIILSLVSGSFGSGEINFNTADNWKRSLWYIMVILPISISILVASSTYFKYGNKWVMLRNAAEEIKSEIYQYRTRVGQYKEPKDISNNPQKPLRPEEKLSQQIEIINNQLMSSEVGLSSLSKYDGDIPPKMYGAAGDDDGLGTLDPDKYVNNRLDGQINYYQGKTITMYKNLQILQWLIFIGGGIGTFIAAIGYPLWVALSSAVVSVFTIYLQYNQIENTLLKYNQALIQLNNLKTWWYILSEGEKKDPINIDKLVNATESTLITEHQTWLKNLKDAVSKVHTIKQAENNEKKG